MITYVKQSVPRYQLRLVISKLTLVVTEVWSLSAYSVVAACPTFICLEPWQSRKRIHGIQKGFRMFARRANLVSSNGRIIINK